MLLNIYLLLEYKQYSIVVQTIQYTSYVSNYLFYNQFLKNIHKEQ